MAASEEDADLVDSDDYYAWLGLGKEATKVEINNAFRRLSRMYHPDKHASNKELHEKSSILFNKVKRAHEVLTDSHKRAIYDTMGVKGLETEGWEIVQRSKSAQEILEEYERLQEEREQRRLNQSTNPKGTMMIGVDASDVFDHYGLLDDYGEYGSVFPHIEINKMSISQSVECPLTPKDTATVSGNLSSHNGNGSGSINVSMRRITSHKGWAEVDVETGSSSGIGFRGFRTLWSRGYGTMSGSLQVTPKGYIKPSFSAMAVTQFDKHLSGRLTYSFGPQSFLNTTVLWDRDKHHIQASVQLGIPHSVAMVSYSYRFPDQEGKVKVSGRLGTFGAVVEYGCEKKISRFSRLGASMVIGVPIGVTLNIRFNRGSQTIFVPVHLSDNLSPEAVFYGTVVPPLLYLIVKNLIVKPFLKEQKDRELKKKREANLQRMAEKRREAQLAMELMMETVERCFEQEEEKGGLVIRKALYGKLHGDDIRDHECIVVTRALQALVKDSTLLLPKDTSLSELPGFYDPCVGEEKELSIRYDFRRQPHSVKVQEYDKILIPSRDMLADLLMCMQ